MQLLFKSKMDWEQLLFNIVTLTPALLSTLVLIYLTHHQGEWNEPLESDTFDYDQYNYNIIWLFPGKWRFMSERLCLFFSCRHRRGCLHLYILIWRSKIWEVYVLSTSLDPSQNNIFKCNVPELSQNTLYIVSDNKKLILEFLAGSH